jgi:hypothetical protein
MSIIIGLSLAEILSTLADSVIRKKERKFSWIHTLLSGGIFFALLQTWWEIWDLQLVDEWAFTHLLIMLCPPVVLFIISRLLNPGREYKGSMDDYYFSYASYIWYLITFGVIIGNSFRAIAFGSPLFIIDNLSAIPLIIISITLGISSNRTLHRVLVPIVIVIVLLDILLINFLIS